MDDKQIDDEINRIIEQRDNAIRCAADLQARLDALQAERDELLRKFEQAQRELQHIRTMLYELGKAYDRMRDNAMDLMT